MQQATEQGHRQRASSPRVQDQAKRADLMKSADSIGCITTCEWVHTAVSLWICASAFVQIPRMLLSLGPFGCPDCNTTGRWVQGRTTDGTRHEHI